MGEGSVAGFGRQPQRLKCVCPSLFPRWLGSVLLLSNPMTEKYTGMSAENLGLKTHIGGSILPKGS